MRPDGVPTSIIPLVAETLHEALLRECKTSVPTSDPSRADHVIIGKPTTELRDNIVVSIHMNHPLGPGSDTDANISGPPMSSKDRPLKFPAETSGGMRTELIIGAVEIRTRQRLEFSEAMWVEGAINARIKGAINQAPELRYLKDDFGNFMSRIETFKHSGYTSGGGKVSIGAGWVDWRAVVHTTNCRRE